ncbi:GNAT family N-acetyltransferase [Macrococcus animalis]|uniref:GNAT family N-acetyltransferase n=1 Tax=Macrococcus animalis TaxID=3395467 RepID=UPI0039BDD826
MEYEIIQYNDSYKEQLIDFILGIQKDEFEIQISREDQPDLENVQSNYLDQGGQFWLAVNNNDEIIGCVALVKLAINNAALKKMFVNQDYRNLKIGKKLLDKVIMTSKNNSIASIYLGTIDKFVSAQHFYSNNGFTLIDKKDIPDDFPVMAVDNRYYMKNL